MQKHDQSLVPFISKAGVRGGEQKPRRFSFPCALFVAALFVGVYTPASAESDPWTKCQGGDDDARIVGCTQMIERGKRESNHERLAAHLSRARAYLDEKDFDRAISDYTSALSLDGRLQAVYGWRARAYRAKGERDKALADFDEAFKLDPNATQLYIERGETYAEKGDLQRAIEDFSAAIRRSPGLPGGYEKRGSAHLARRDLDAAIADFDKAIALKPQSVDVFVGRADAFRARGDFSRAKRDLETALKLDPAFPSARKSVAELSEAIIERGPPPPPPSAHRPGTTATSRAGEPKLESFLTQYRSAAIVTEFALVLAALWHFLSSQMRVAHASETGETPISPVFRKVDRASAAIVVGRAEQGVKLEENHTADQFRHLVHDHEMQEEAERVEHRQALQEALEKRVKELAARRLSDAGWRKLLARARESAAAGEKEFMLIRFPSQLCVDGGRAINAPDANWPQTLRGEPADIFARWRQELAPKGFRLAAQIVEFPEGVPGDAGLFLMWDA